MRRVDDDPESLNVRVALLEQSRTADKALADYQYAESKRAIESLHVRLTSFERDFTVALDRGVDALMDKMEADKKELKPTYDQVVTNTAAISWIKKWLGAVSVLEAAICTWVLAHVGGKQ